MALDLPTEHLMAVGERTSYVVSVDLTGHLVAVTSFLVVVDRLPGDIVALGVHNGHLVVRTRFLVAVDLLSGHFVALGVRKSFLVAVHLQTGYLVALGVKNWTSRGCRRPEKLPRGC